MKYQDRKVFFISTIHQNDKTVATRKVKRGEVVRKPKLIADYNKHMGGVDKNEQIINTYTSVRKSHKWVTKVFFHFFDEAIFNSFLLYRRIHPQTLFLTFKIEVTKLMLALNDPDGPATIPRKAGRHYIRCIADRKSRKCIYCPRQQRKNTRYECKQCPTHPALCINECFENFTKNNLLFI